MLVRYKKDRQNHEELQKPSVLLSLTFIFVGFSLLLSLFSNSVFDRSSSTYNQTNHDITHVTSDKSKDPIDNSQNFPLENSEDTETPEDFESLEESDLENEKNYGYFQWSTLSKSLIYEAEKVNKLRLVCNCKALKFRSERSLVLLLHSWKIPHS